jgi:general stress protein 26
VPLSGKELEAFLQEAHLAHFATSGPDGTPNVRPIWFCYADGAFWFTTRLEARRTGADVANGSRVAVSIATEDRPNRAVIAHGRPEVWKKTPGVGFSESPPATARRRGSAGLPAR